MAEFEKITGLNQLERWLTTQDVRMSRTIAARAALRALPALMAVSDQTFGETPGETLLLTALRVTLLSGIAATCPTLDMQNLQKALSSVHHASVHIGPLSPARSAYSAASSASLSAESAWFSAESASFSAESAVRSVTLSIRTATFYSKPYAESAAFWDATVAQDLGRAAVFGHPLWPEGKAVAPLLAHWDTFKARPDPEGIWSFWRDWYRGMLNGTPLDWDLQLQVALIKPDVWDAGPKAVAKEIASIQQAFKAKGHEENKPSSEQTVSPATAESMAQLLQTNRDAISLTTASLLEQIAEFREKMRGNNHLESEFREEILAFLDQLSEKLRNLIEALTAVAETTDTKAGEKAVLWLRDFKAHFFKEAAIYASPENIAKSAIPTGIILGCTAVGSLVGMPVPGTIVGGLITGQLKPGKAADDLLKPKSSGGD